MVITAVFPEMVVPEITGAFTTAFDTTPREVMFKKFVVLRFIGPLAVALTLVPEMNTLPPPAVASIKMLELPGNALMFVANTCGDLTEVLPVIFTPAMLFPEIVVPDTTGEVINVVALNRGEFAVITLVEASVIAAPPEIV